MKVLRTSDIITLKANGIECDFSPLTYERSLEIQECTRTVAGKVVVDGARQTRLLVKYAVKEIRGATDFKENPIIIKADETGLLNDQNTEDAITVLLHTPFVGPLSYMSATGNPKSYDGIEVHLNGEILILGNE